jgi:hypothetical protein
MKSRSRILVLTLFALLPGSLLLAKETKTQKTLAYRLPASTIFYAQVSVPSLLRASDQYLSFVDAEAAEEFVSEIKTLHGLVKEIGAEYEFEPRLFDKILKSKLYFVVNRETKPKVTGPSFSVTSSLIVETTPKTAKDFLEQFKGLMERLKEKHPETGRYDYKELEIEEGELLAIGTNGVTLGRHGRYIVLSNDRPETLWIALDSPPDTSLADTELFQRYAHAKPSSKVMYLLNLEELILQLEATLKRNLTVARDLLSNDKDSGDDEEGIAPPIREQFAEQSLNSFQSAKKLLSLDQVKTFGGTLAWQTGKRNCRAKTRMDLLLGENISPLLRQILDGGHRFQLPPMGKTDHLCIFLRTGVSKILGSILSGLDDATMQQYQQSMMMMKGVVGYTVGEIFDHLAGDVYILVDINERKHKTLKLDKKTGEVETKTTVGPLPELFVFLGVKDREAFSKVLSDVVTRLSSGPFASMLGKFLSQRVYQGVDVYLVGQGLEVEGHDPDGLTSYAMVVIDRHFTFGSWKEVTALIRRSKAAEKGASRKLASIVKEHQESNFLLVAPSSWSKKLQKVGEKNDGEAWDHLIGESLKGFLALSEDEDVRTRFKAALKRLKKHSVALSRKGQDLAVDPTVGDGKLSGGLYEFKVDFKYRKKE